MSEAKKYVGYLLFALSFFFVKMDVAKQVVISHNKNLFSGIFSVFNYFQFRFKKHTSISRPRFKDYFAIKLITRVFV